MRKMLNNLMSFDIYKAVNEDLSGRSQRKSDEIFASKGDLQLASGAVVNARDIVNVVKDAVDEIKMEWTSFYNFAKSATIFYTYNNPQCPTMYVTNTLEIHVSANYVHDTLKMDKDLVMAILMHEIFHVVYDHIQRGLNWLNSYGKQLNVQTSFDNNLAADIEVNATLVNKGIISYDRLTNECHGLFLTKTSDNIKHNFVNVVSMENILEDEDAMDRLRHMTNYPWPQDQKQQDKDDQNDQQGDDGGDSQSGSDTGSGAGSSTGSSTGNGNSEGIQQGESGDSSENQESSENSEQGESSNNSKKDGNSPNGGSGNGDDSSENGAGAGSPGDKGSAKELSAQKAPKLCGEFGDAKDKKSTDMFKDDDTYTEEEKSELEGIRKETEIRNSKSEMEKRKKEYVNSLSKNDAVRKIIEKASIDSKKYENIWKKMLEKFLEHRHRPGTKVNGSKYDWMNKHRMANHMYGINIPKEAEDDPQDINLYVDVSGSMDDELISIICESILVYCNKFKYSGLNLIPWATESGSVYHIESVDKRGKDQVSKEIIAILSNAPRECGYGTNGKATVKSIAKVCVENLKTKNKKTKDDVHIIITDGYICELETFEKDMFNEVKNATNIKIAKKALHNTLWMIYDNNEHERVEKCIQNGKIVWMTSSIVKGGK